MPHNAYEMFEIKFVCLSYMFMWGFVYVTEGATCSCEVLYTLPKEQNVCTKCFDFRTKFVMPVVPVLLNFHIRYLKDSSIHRLRNSSNLYNRRIHDIWEYIVQSTNNEKMTHFVLKTRKIFLYSNCMPLNIVNFCVELLFIFLNNNSSVAR